MQCQVCNTQGFLVMRLQPLLPGLRIDVDPGTAELRIGRNTAAYLPFSQLSA